jgi:hypothetical protein
MKYAVILSINETILKEIDPNKNTFMPIGTEQLSFTINIEGDSDNDVAEAVREKLREIREICEAPNV